VKVLIRVGELVPERAVRFDQLSDQAVLCLSAKFVVDPRQDDDEAIPAVRCFCDYSGVVSRFPSLAMTEYEALCCEFDSGRMLEQTHNSVRGFVEVPQVIVAQPVVPEQFDKLRPARISGPRSSVPGHAPTALHVVRCPDLSDHSNVLLVPLDQIVDDGVVRARYAWRRDSLADAELVDGAAGPHRFSGAQ